MYTIFKIIEKVVPCRKYYFCERRSNHRSILDICFNFPIIAMMDLRNVAFSKDRKNGSVNRRRVHVQCTRRATNWRLTIIMIIYLASISREVKCETVTEIRYDVRCHSSNCAIKEIR